MRPTVIHRLPPSPVLPPSGVPVQIQQRTAGHLWGPLLAAASLHRFSEPMTCKPVETDFHYQSENCTVSEHQAVFGMKIPWGNMVTGAGQLSLEKDWNEAVSQTAPSVSISGGQKGRNVRRNATGPERQIPPWEFSQNAAEAEVLKCHGGRKENP